MTVWWKICCQGNSRRTKSTTATEGKMTELLDYECKLYSPTSLYVMIYSWVKTHNKQCDEAALCNYMLV